MITNRRNWLVRVGQAASGAAVDNFLSRTRVRTGFAESPSGQAVAGPSGNVGPRGIENPQAREYLETVLYTRQEVDEWLGVSGREHMRERYDADIGWVPVPARLRDGVDGSVSAYTYEPSGARRMTSYDGSACRINTYGDSFTHCDQVSDGETWQERLAAHLSEPIRNFGVSGNSFYQMYVRMKREEARTPAAYIIFNIHGGGYWGSIQAWSGLAIPRSNAKDHVYRRPTNPFVAVNLARGEFEEFGNRCPTPESLYNLCDLDWVYQHFKDDFQLAIILARRNIARKTPEKSYDSIEKVAQEQGIPGHVDSAESLAATVDQVAARSAVYCNMRIVEKIEEYAAAHSKQVLYILSHIVDDVAKALANGTRFDQELVDFLERKRLPYVDDLEAHRRDFARYKVTAEDYLKPYYIGHYTPLGNFFQAFAVKNKLVEMLDPKPVSYGTLPG